MLTMASDTEVAYSSRQFLFFIHSIINCRCCHFNSISVTSDSSHRIQVTIYIVHLNKLQSFSDSLNSPAFFSMDRKSNLVENECTLHLKKFFNREIFIYECLIVRERESEDQYYSWWIMTLTKYLLCIPNNNSKK